jgi:hypothetical protein
MILKHRTASYDGRHRTAPFCTFILACCELTDKKGLVNEETYGVDERRGFSTWLALTWSNESGVDVADYAFLETSLVMRV